MHFQIFLKVKDNSVCMFVLSQLGSEIDKNKFKMIFFMENNSLRKSDINNFDHIDPFGFSRNTLHNY